MRRRQKIRSTAFVLLVGAISSSWAAEAFTGLPVYLTTISADKSVRTRLDANAQLASKMHIVEKDERFFWASRDMKELFKVTSGVVITYQTADGSGYIKMIDLSRLNQEMRKSLGSNSETQYIEHFSLGLTTFTYQGSLLQ